MYISRTRTLSINPHVLVLHLILSSSIVTSGTVATTAALTYGLISFYRGNKIMSQYMMRARVAAQSFTILSMALGFVIVASRQEK